MPAIVIKEVHAKTFSSLFIFFGVFSLNLRKTRNKFHKLYVKTRKLKIQ